MFSKSSNRRASDLLGLGTASLLAPEIIEHMQFLFDRRRLPGLWRNDIDGRVAAPTTARRLSRSTSPKSAIPRSPVSRKPRPVTRWSPPLKQKIETLQAELIETKAMANGHRAEFERECERTNKLLAELLKTTSESTGAREKAALLEGKLSMLTQPWRRRLADAFSLALPQVAPRKSAGSVVQSHN